MVRKRSEVNDYVCRRCGCPCDPAGTRHLGGGQGLRACGRAPDAILRTEHEADIDAWVNAYLRDR